MVPIIQSFAQLDKNYGKEGAEVIIDTIQDTLAGGFAQNSAYADSISKSLGTKTVMSGSVSKSQDNPSQSLQMIERPLMTPDELRNMPKGTFVTLKTGFHPMKTKLKLFFKWGIEFDKDNPYTMPEHSARKVAYASKAKLEAAIRAKYQNHDESDDVLEVPKGGGEKEFFEEKEEKHMKGAPPEDRMGQYKELYEKGGHKNA